MARFNYLSQSSHALNKQWEPRFQLKSLCPSTACVLIHNYALCFWPHELINVLEDRFVHICSLGMIANCYPAVMNIHKC